MQSTLVLLRRPEPDRQFVSRRQRLFRRGSALAYLGFAQDRQSNPARQSLPSLAGQHLACLATLLRMHRQGTKVCECGGAEKEGKGEDKTLLLASENFNHAL